MRTDIRSFKHQLFLFVFTPPSPHRTKTLGEDSVEVAEVLFHYAEVLVKAVQENEDGAGMLFCDL